MKNLLNYNLKSFRQFAYTLVEVIIVMLIIAVVVSISIKATKAKLNNITSYTYYSAYQTVNSVTNEMLKDFDADNADYISNNSIFYKFFPPAFAQDCLHEELDKCYLAKYATGLDIDNYIQRNYPGATATIGADLVLREYVEKVLNLTSYGKMDDIIVVKNHNFDDDIYDCLYYYSQGECVGQTTSIYHNGDAYQSLPNEYVRIKFWFIYTEPLEDPNPDPEQSTTATPLDPPSCTPTACTGGNEFDMTSCSCVCNKTAPDTIPCGKVWSESQCQLEDITPWPPTCEAGKEFNPTEAVCGCVPIPQAIPRTGENYCKLFLSYSNTSPQLAEADECKGDAISTDETEFSDKAPDMILRNGMRLYNVSQDPEKITVLEGNSKGRTFTRVEADGTTTEIDMDEWGYTLYVDIDGERNGNGVLWEDVFPFYVTLSGNVVPVYDIDSPETVGGDNKLYLQTSVFDEWVDDTTGRNTQWITKSRPFKESACAMGYVNASTPYCSTAPAITTNAQCMTIGHDCRLKTILPIKFFGR